MENKNEQKQYAQKSHRIARRLHDLAVSWDVNWSRCAVGRPGDEMVCGERMIKYRKGRLEWWVG